MDILHLTYFLEVAHQKSFTKASQTLHVSQPSISKSIRTLEAEWGQQLFHREGRSIELTDAGEAILPQIEQIVTQFRQLEEQVADTKNLEQGQITIGIPPMIGSSFLSPIIKNFITTYPQIQLHVEERGSNVIAEGVQQGHLQVGYVALPLANTINTENMKLYIFNKEPLRLVIPLDSPFRKFKKVTLEDIKDESLIFFTEAFSLYHLILQQYQQLGIKPRIVAQSDTWDFISEMVKSGLGVAMLPAHICQRLDRQQVHVIDIEPTVPWIIAMIWKDDHLLTAQTKLWLNYVKKELPEII